MLVEIVVVNVITDRSNIDEEANRKPEFKEHLLSGVYQGIDANTKVNTSSDDKYPPSVVIESLLINVRLFRLFSILSIVNIGKCTFRFCSFEKLDDSS